MTCRDLPRLADSFLSGELTDETNQEILRHLDSCHSCRAQIDEQRRLRSAVGTAVRGAPDLQPPTRFSAQLRNRLRLEAEQQQHARARSRGPWLAAAAGLVLAVGITAALVLSSPGVAPQALAQDAIGDHRNCALTFRLARQPMPLLEAAGKFDSAFRELLSRPPDDISTPGGPVRVLERHVCVYGTRRFGHIIMRYHEHVVSLLMTSRDVKAGANQDADATPHTIGRSRDGLSVVSVSGSSHSFLMVADLGNEELRQLSEIIAKPLAQRLETGILLPDAKTVLALPRLPPAASNRPLR